MLKLLTAVALSTSLLFLAACSPTPAGFGATTGSTTGGSGGGGTTGGSSGSSSSLQLGYTDTTGNFHPGAILVAAPGIAAGGQTLLQASIVDGNNGNSPYTASVVQLSFSSPCSSDKLATITSPINTSNGLVSTTYIAQGCSGKDTVTVSATIGASAPITATADVTIAASNYEVGYLDSVGSFHQGQLAIGTSPLSAGGSASIQMDVVDTNADFAHYVLSPLTVAFSSPCSTAGTSSLTSPISNGTGMFSASYTAEGCGGTDVVTATTTLPGGKQLSATGRITVQSAVLGQLSFVSATPSNLGIQGTGFPTSSTVVFKLLSETGVPATGQTVHFTLSSTAGGVTLSSPTSVTATDGTARVTVVSGAQHALTTVVASVTDASSGATLTSQTTAPITISTGVPTSSNVSVALGAGMCPNLEIYQYDGVDTPIVVRATDRFQYPVPDGTQILFKTESGYVTPSCTTSGGQCTATFTSQEPRPDGTDGGVPGHSIVLAYANGEESFVDENGSGVFSSGDPHADLSELYLDFNGNGQHDDAEPFVDYNGNGKFDAGDGKFTGLLCTDASICSASFAPGAELNVGQSIEIIWSGSSVVPARVTTTLNGSGSFDSLTGTLTFKANKAGGGQIALALVDQNGEPLPAGTTVSMAGANATVFAPASTSTPCLTSRSLDANTYFFNFGVSSNPSGTTGSLVVTVTTPKSAPQAIVYQIVFN